MNQNISRIITGLIILLIGVGALLSATNVFPFWSLLSTWWPLLIVAAGLLVLAGNPKSNFLWGIALIVIGGLLQFNQLDVLSFNAFSLIWPIAIIAVGLSVLWNGKGRFGKQDLSKDVDDISVIFSGSEVVNKSKNYNGGKITAIFGGTSIDLRDAVINKEATLDIFTLCGGVELRVPREWRVVSKVTPILGGVENKALGSEDHKGPVLLITGIAALGGVEVKT